MLSCRHLTTVRGRPLCRHGTEIRLTITVQCQPYRALLNPMRIAAIDAKTALESPCNLLMQEMIPFHSVVECKSAKLDIPGLVWSSWVDSVLNQLRKTDILPSFGSSWGANRWSSGGRWTCWNSRSCAGYTLGSEHPGRGRHCTGGSLATGRSLLTTVSTDEHPQFLSSGELSRFC